MNLTVKRILIAILAIMLASVIFILGYFTHSWVQPTAASSLEWAINLIKDYYYEDVSKELSGNSGDYAINYIVNTYLDKYSRYYTPEEYTAALQSNAGNKVGLGISYSYVEGEGVLINYAFVNSPAYEAGVRGGDVYTGAQTEEESVTFESIGDFNEIVDSVEIGEKIKLFYDGGQVEVTKSEFTASYVYLCTNTSAWTVDYVQKDGKTELRLVESPNDKIEFLPDGAGYIKLIQFYGDNTALEFGQLIKKFNELNCTDLYLDLRGNGGGYVEVMQGIAGYFVDEGRVAMTARHRNGKRDTYNVYEPERLREDKVADVTVGKDVDVHVLANNATASASEALIGVLVSYGVVDYSNIYVSNFSDEYMAWLGYSESNDFNGRTYGKGIMQETRVNYATNEAIKLTTAKIYWPNDKCIHDVGLGLSDGCNLVDAEWSVTEDDNELRLVTQMVEATAT